MLHLTFFSWIFLILFFYLFQYVYSETVIIRNHLTIEKDDHFLCPLFISWWWCTQKSYAKSSSSFLENTGWLAINSIFKKKKNYCTFFLRGYGLITDLKRLKFYYISLHILRDYVYSFCQIFQRLCVFKRSYVYSGL